MRDSGGLAGSQTRVLGGLAGLLMRDSGGPVGLLLCGLGLSAPGDRQCR